MNFFPHFHQNKPKTGGIGDSNPDYVINGTNLFSNDGISDWNIFLPTFGKEDYQFDG
jgi:hypothetical protein